MVPIMEDYFYLLCNGTMFVWGSVNIVDGYQVREQQCFWTNPQLMMVLVAPESRSAVVDIVLSKVVGMILTARDIAHGGFLERTYACKSSSFLVLWDVIF